MSRLKLLLDTNVVIDYLNEREPYYEKARLLMLCGRVGEFSLWISSSQVTDLVYILSNGGCKAEIPRVLERLRGLRTFVDVYPVGDREVDRMLATSWRDPEDALLFEVALRMKADCLVTRNQGDFEGTLVKVLDCEGLFSWIEKEYGLVYGEVGIS